MGEGMKVQLLGWISMCAFCVSSISAACRFETRFRAGTVLLSLYQLNTNIGQVGWAACVGRTSPYIGTNLIRLVGRNRIGYRSGRLGC